eukprot:gnl/MRDRNA2_/MRDRNA2_74348_c0_seq2.p1 gnl/MRDRNA2_/MRDRNA2_74348_c0~~gnl/MRDRNA2_/MRDRNA2_74348_c0_seq2.p1  ORF type:complete len:325 (+),score=57.12 gnl/MRDRNA2_/MRDRNA2_74348_c0_seq2:125-1099(+)
MRLSWIVQLASLAQAHVKMEVSRISHGHNSVNQIVDLADKLVDRARGKQQLRNADIDEATIAKTRLGTRYGIGGTSAFSIPLKPITTANLQFPALRAVPQHSFSAASHKSSILRSASRYQKPTLASRSSLPVQRAVSEKKEGISFDGVSLDGSDVRIGIIKASWNFDIIDGLYKGVSESLTECGVKPSNVFTTTVPGAYELPVAAKLLASTKRVDAIICLGCLIKGDTMHFEYIAEAASSGIMKVSLDTSIPCLFGVLTVLNKQQAIIRSEGEKNEGLAWGKSAVDMGLKRIAALSAVSGTPIGKKEALWDLPPARDYDSHDLP